jgi:nucleoside-diphosphate-sugar epimerase
MSRVLVTGASGFIGSHCVPLLVEAGYDVHGVVPEGVEPQAAGITWHSADLLERDQVRQLMDEVRPTHLLHLAWFVEPGEFWRSSENLRWLQSGLDLVRSFADAGGERSVMAGTCVEYAPSTEPLLEGVTPIGPTTLYGACKAALHLSSSAFYEERGVSRAWGHIFYLYGPREHPGRLVPSVISALGEGTTFVCQHPHDVRDFLHVEDVASAFVALLGSEVEGAVNIASGEPTAVGELVTTLAGVMGRPDLVDCSAVAPEQSRIVGDNGRLRNEVGWRPRFDLDSGLAATVGSWMRDRGQGGSAAVEGETP